MSKLKTSLISQFIGYGLVLKLEDILLSVAELSQSAGDLTLISRGVLHTGDRLVQGRRATDEDLQLLGSGHGGQGLLQELLGDVAQVQVSFSQRLQVQLVNEVVNLHLGVVLSQFVELLLQDDVLSGLRAVVQLNEGLVIRVLSNGVHQLPQGGDTRATTNQGNGVKLVRLPLPLDNRALERQGLTLLQFGDVLRHLTQRVALDDEVNSANLTGVGHGSVRSHDIVALGGDVLGQDTRGGDKTRNIVLVGVLERQVLGVVGQLLGLDELQVNPLVVTLEDFVSLVVERARSQGVVRNARSGNRSGDGVSQLGKSSEHGHGFRHKFWQVKNEP